MPYEPFVDALRALVAGCPADELRDFVGGEGTDLIPLVPAVAERLALGRPDDDDDETETGRYRMFEAVRAVLTRVSLAVPLLLVLDDLQWARKPTLLLLRHVVQVASPGLLAIGIFRDTDLDRTSSLAGILADLRRDRHVERVQLGGLSESEVNEFVEIAAGHAFDASIVELAKPCTSRPRATRSSSDSSCATRPVRCARPARRPLVDEPSSTGARHPRRGAGADRPTLSRLSPVANDVLGVASVIGRSFDTTMLAAASGVEQDDVLDAGGRGGGPSHRAGAGPRRPLHVRPRWCVRRCIASCRPAGACACTVVSDSSSRRGAGDDSQRWAELARHFSEAASLGEVDRAVRYGTLAEVEPAGLAFEDAAAHYEGALGALELLDEPDRALRADVKLGLGNALRRAATIGSDRSSSTSCRRLGHWATGASSRGLCSASRAATRAPPIPSTTRSSPCWRRRSPTAAEAACWPSCSARWRWS